MLYLFLLVDRKLALPGGLSMIETILTVLALASSANCQPAHLLHGCLSKSLEQAGPSLVLSSFQNNVVQIRYRIVTHANAADPKVVTAAKAFALSQSSAASGLKIAPSIQMEKKTRYEIYCKLGADGVMDAAVRKIKSANDRAVAAERNIQNLRAKKDQAAQRARDAPGKRRSNNGGPWYDGWWHYGPTKWKASPQEVAAVAQRDAAESSIQSAIKSLESAKKRAAELSGEIEASKLECAINFYLETTVAAGAGVTLPKSNIDLLKAKSAWDSLSESERLWRAKEYVKRLTAPPAKSTK